MSRRSNQKLKLLYLAKILLEKTDDRQGITLTQILEELSKYGIESGRKSLYDDMELLRVYGYDVRTSRDRYVRYHIGRRDIDRAELKLICDLLCAGGILNDNELGELIKRLWHTEYMQGIELPDIKSELSQSSELYKNMKLICKAMAEDAALTFKCFEWNAYKQRKLTESGRTITASPWKLIYTEEGYKMIAYDHDKKTVSEFLLSKMLMTAITGYRREGEELATAYKLEGGKRDKVRLRCDNSRASELFVRFGMGVTVTSNNEDCFEVAFTADINKAFYSWIFTCAGGVTILSPTWAAEEYRALVRGSYEDGDAK